MRGLIVAALIAVALPSVQAHAQTAPVATTDPESIAISILEPLKRGNIADAIKAVENGSPPAIKGRSERLAGVRGQMEAMITSNGPVIRWERVKTEPLGTMVRRDTYIVQYHDTVLRWRFTYMKVEGGWMIGGFTFDDQADTWF